MVTEVREAVEISGGVLVGHDGSECAQQALRWAAGLAARADLDLHVVRAWGMTTARPGNPASCPRSPTASRRCWRNWTAA